MDAIEKRARELLAAEYAKGQFRAYAPEIRNGTTVAFDEEIRAIVAIIAALAPPQGYVLVPTIPSLEMIQAAAHKRAFGAGNFEIWSAMLAARPEVKP